MIVILAVEAVNFKEGKADWWREPERLEKVLRLVHAAGLWSAFLFYGKAGAKARKIKSIADLVAESISWKAGIYRFSCADGGKADCFLDLQLARGALSLTIGFSRGALEAKSEVLLDELLDVGCRLHEEFQATAVIGPVFEIVVLDMPYPRVRPPRLHRHFAFGAAATFLCRDFHEDPQYGEPADVEKMVEAPVPEGVVRSERGDLVIIRWVTSLADRAHVRERCSLQEQWMTAVLDPPVDPSYNRFGDYRISPVSLRNHPPLTFYDTFTLYGYKAVVLHPDGGVEEEILEEAASWLRNGRLPDGKPLSGLYFILPNRESALLLRGQAEAIGAKGVLYMDNEKRLWDPFPPGPWLEPLGAGA